MATQTKVCDACGQSVTYTGHRGFRDAHRVCPKAGVSAIDDDHKACPRHGSLVWVIGPYSTFRACAERYCAEGRRGKPWRYCAPRGEYADGGRDDSDDAEATIAAVATNPPPPEVRSTPTDNGGIELTALGGLLDAIKAHVERRASEIAAQCADKWIKQAQADGKLATRTIEFKCNGEVFARIEGVHHRALLRLIKLYKAGFRNFLVVGPAGSGKTTLAQNLATALAREFGQVSCTSGMSESALVGRGIPNLTTGETVYESTDFVRCYETGGVFLLDEVDAADANVMLVINSALANGHMSLTARTANPAAVRHADSVIICAANTWGTGADRQYVGRNQLDAAFLDRFVGSVIEVDYDRDLEKSLIGDNALCERVWSVRDKARTMGLRRVVGTRFLMSVARLVKGAGETVGAALTACTVGWTADERSKAGV